VPNSGPSFHQSLESNLDSFGPRSYGMATRLVVSPEDSPGLSIPHATTPNVVLGLPTLRTALLHQQCSTHTQTHSVDGTPLSLTFPCRRTNSRSTVRSCCANSQVLPTSHRASRRTATHAPHPVLRQRRHSATHSLARWDPVCRARWNIALTTNASCESTLGCVNLSRCL
jgi:hypothetical protein